MNIQVSALEIQNGNIFRFQLRFAVANIHAHPIKQVIAMRLNN